MKELEQIIAFIHELEKLKNVERRIIPKEINRRENSAEHSWHVSITALSLEKYANAPIDIFVVIKMLLLHDIVEIDCGDVIVYDEKARAQKALYERKAAVRLFGMLPEHIGNEFLQLWNEFEDEESAESIYAKAIDRVIPILQNFENGAQSWKEHNISKQQVIDTCQATIEKGSKDLWAYVNKEIEKVYSTKTINK